jgi:hypothetical protein
MAAVECQQGPEANPDRCTGGDFSTQASHQPNREEQQGTGDEKSPQCRDTKLAVNHDCVIGSICELFNYLL